MPGRRLPSLESVSSAVEAISHRYVGSQQIQARSSDVARELVPAARGKETPQATAVHIRQVQVQCSDVD